MTQRLFNKIAALISLLLLSACLSYPPHRAPLSLGVQVNDGIVYFTNLKKRLENYYSKEAKEAHFYLLGIAISEASCIEDSCYGAIWKISSNKNAKEVLSEGTVSKDFPDLPDEIFYGEEVLGMITDNPARTLLVGKSYKVRMHIVVLKEIGVKVSVIDGHARFKLENINGVLSALYEGSF